MLNAIADNKADIVVCVHSDRPGSAESAIVVRCSAVLGDLRADRAYVLDEAIQSTVGPLETLRSELQVVVESVMPSDTSFSVKT